MQKDRSKEREIFLKYLKDIYLQNSDLDILSESIYAELTRFNVLSNKISSISYDSLVGIQVVLNNKYKNNEKVNTFTSSDGNFWVIENRMGKSDKEYYDNVNNGIKLYIPVQIENLCKIAEKLFNYMINEEIIMQCKIPKEMRNDALICRVRTREDVTKVSNYIKSLNYKSNIRPNPFLYDNGNMCITIDSSLSYNSVTARLLEQYLNTRRTSKNLEDVCCNDFNDFIKSQTRYLSDTSKKSIMDLYNINNERKYSEFIIISQIISANLEGSLNDDKLFDYQYNMYIKTDDSKKSFSEQDYSKILYVINTLATYYSIEHVHKIIMQFINSGEYNLFTRKIGNTGGVRAIIENNFSSEDVKLIITNLGWRALISASKLTYDKYGENQLYAAIKNIFNSSTISEFTNDNEARSRLGLIIPKELLREVIISKLNENNMDINAISLMKLVLMEIYS